MISKKKLKIILLFTLGILFNIFSITIPNINHLSENRYSCSEINDDSNLVYNNLQTYR